MSRIHALAWALSLCLLLGACARPPGPAVAPQWLGTGDLGLVVERADGRLQLVNTSSRSALGRIEGLGDLSHASIVYGRDGLHAYVFGRDGALSKVHLGERRVVARIQQAGNSIGGAISQDGRLVVAQNYQPGGIKVFDAQTLQPLADIPAEYAPGKFSRVVGLADLPGQRFIYALFDADEIWIADLADPRSPKLQRFRNIGRQGLQEQLVHGGIDVGAVGQDFGHGGAT